MFWLSVGDLLDDGGLQRRLWMLWSASGEKPLYFIFCVNVPSIFEVFFVNFGSILDPFWLHSGV